MRPYPDDYSNMERPLINNALKCLAATLVIGLAIAIFVYWVGL